MRFSYPVALILACLSSVLVQALTETLEDADGETVVEVVTTNAAGAPTTRTLSTVAGATTTTQAAAAANQGPVAQPATTQTGQTVYTYTTTDADGDTTVLQGIFTPSFSTAIVSPSTTFTGTVLQYSEWLSMVGTNTAAANDVASGAGGVRLGGAWKAVVGLGAGVLGGAWLALA